MGILLFLVLVASNFADDDERPRKKKSADEDERPRKKKSADSTPPPPVVPKRKPPRTLQIGVLKDGKNPNCTDYVEVGDEVEISWNLTLFSTRKQLEATDEDESYVFRIGYGEVIAGVEQGILGMCVGEKRRVNIPPGLAYGLKGDGKNVPGGVSLSIEIELLDHEHREYDEKWKNRLERLAEGESDEDIKNFPNGDPEEQREREREREKENDRKKSGRKETKEEKERRLEHRKERLRHRHPPHREHGEEARINQEWEEFVQFKIEKREGREYKESHPIPKPMKKTEEELEKEEETKKRIEKKKKKKGKGFPKNIEEMGELQPDGSRLVNYSYSGGQDDDDDED